MGTRPSRSSNGAEASRLASGPGWRVSDVVCRSGPEDRPYEEAHPWVSVSAVVHGTFVYRSTHGRALMTPGSILLGNQGACYCCSHEHGRGDRCIAFHFDPATIESVASDLRGVRQTGFAGHRLPPHDTLAPLLSAARALLFEQDPLLAEQTAIRIAGAALRVAQDGEEAPTSLVDEARVAAAVALIVAKHDEPLSLADMAQVAGVGRYHFLRMFRRVVGTTPYAYLLNRRLAVAADALRDGSDVLGAMLAGGFGDLSDFTRRFGAKFGRSPAAFRRDSNAPEGRVTPSS